jgi:hypothetical protein
LFETISRLRLGLIRVREKSIMNAMRRPVIIGCSIGLRAVGVFSRRFACTLMDFREDIRSPELEKMR